MKTTVFNQNQHLTELVKAMEDITIKSEHAADCLMTMILKRL